jgi:hypothetical protein
VIPCHKCKYLLPLTDAEPDELAGWVCAICGTLYRAAIDPQSSDHERRQVLLAQRTKAQGLPGIRLRRQSGLQTKNGTAAVLRESAKEEA